MPASGFPIPDAIDARLLADIGRSDFHRLRRLNPDSEHVQKLKMLCRDQDTLLEDATRPTWPAHRLPEGVLPGSP
ncbi:IS110 family transposase [Thermodesulfitimonas sp.]